MKGDTITVRVAAGQNVHDVTLTASKAGRTVRAKYAAKWLDVTETTRPTAANPTGRPTGNKLRVRLEAVVSVEERYQDGLETPRIRVTSRPDNTATLPWDS